MKRNTSQPIQRRRLNWRWWVTAALVSALVLPLAATTLAKSKKDREPPRRAKNLNKAPRLAFERGMLRRDGLSRWCLDGDTPLVFNRESQLHDQTAPASQAVPQEGRTVILMGHYVGASFVVHTGTMLDPFSEETSWKPIPSGGEDAELPEMPASGPQ